MIFTDIRLQHYRSYADASFELGSGVTIVVGSNAAGKTNLLEGLMVAATGKSYRAKNDLLIESGQDWARIDVHTDTNQTRVVKIEHVGHSATARFEIDDKQYARLSHLTRQPVVLFEPNHLLLFHDEPAKRRDYLDDLIEQYTPGYASLRASYRRVVAQRNALLKQGGHGVSQLFAWNIRLSEIAEKLVSQRVTAVQHLNSELSTTYNVISQKQQSVSLVYQSKTHLSQYGSTLLAQLEATVETDLQRGFTSHGPHRDDIIAFFGETPAVDSASRGEIRTLLLCLKIIELKMLETHTGKRPLLLLDDVFSELDGARRRALTDFLKDYQTLITTTDADAVIQHFGGDHSVIAI